jgi:hypothetical protein
MDMPLPNLATARTLTEEPLRYEPTIDNSCPPTRMFSNILKFDPSLIRVRIDNADATQKEATMEVDLEMRVSDVTDKKLPNLVKARTETFDPHVAFSRIDM